MTGPADTLFEPGVPQFVPPPQAALLLPLDGAVSVFAGPLFAPPTEAGVPLLLPPPAPDLLLPLDGPTNTFVGPLFQPITFR